MSLEEDLKRKEELDKRIDERISNILEFHPERFDEHHSICDWSWERGRFSWIPPLPIKNYHIWYKEQIVYVTLGAPSGYEGESNFDFPLEWVSNDVLYKKKVAEFKKKHDKMQKDIDEYYKRKDKADEEEEKLEKEIEELRRRKIKEIEKKYEV